MKAYTINSKNCIEQFHSYLSTTIEFLHGIIHGLIFASSEKEARMIAEKTVFKSNGIFNDIAYAIGFEGDLMNLAKKAFGKGSYWYLNIIEVQPNIWALYSSGYINLDIASDILWCLNTKGTKQIYCFSLCEAVNRLRSMLERNSKQFIETAVNDFVGTKNSLQSMQGNFGGKFLEENTPPGIFAMAYKEAMLSCSTEQEYVIPTANAVGAVWKVIQERGALMVDWL